MSHGDVLSPAPRTAWRELVAEDPTSTIYQTPEWFDTARQLTGTTDVSRLYVLHDGRRLLLPLLRRSPVPRLAFDSSYPGRLGSGGLLGTGGLRPSDVHLVLSDLLTTRSASIRLREHHSKSSHWETGLVPGVTSRRMQVESVDLRDGFDHLFAHGFTSSARRNVRKAERVGVTVERDTTGRLVPQLYKLYLDWTTDRAEQSGLPLWAASALARRREPLQMFQKLAVSTGDACRVWVARHDGEPIAAAMTFVHGTQAVYFRGYSKVAKTRRVYANNLIQSLAMQDACEAGCTSYGMGYSGGVPGLEDFKRSMGATPGWAVECRIDRIGLSRAEQLSARAQNTAAEAVRRLRGRAAAP